MMDGCGSRSFNRCTDVVKSIVHGFQISQHDTRIGAVVFSRRAKVLFGFKDFSTEKDIYAALDNIKYRVKQPRNGVNIGRALQVARDELFSEARKGVQKVLVLVIGGAASDDIIMPAKYLRGDGIAIYGVGLGKDFNVHQLQAIASHPVAKHVFASRLRPTAGVLGSLRAVVCRSKAVKSNIGF